VRFQDSTSDTYWNHRNFSFLFFMNNIYILANNLRYASIAEKANKKLIFILF